MQIYNYSTNALTVNTWWPDSSTQVIEVAPGAVGSAPGYVDSNGVAWGDGLTHQYQLVNADTTGLVRHDLGSIQDDFFYGFEFTAVLTALAFAAWAVKRGLRPVIID
jgi:hypothetical protein